MASEKRNKAVLEKASIALKDLPKGLSKRFAKSYKREVADEIVKVILSGKSPVKGKKFKKYSKSYKDAISGKTKFRNIGGKVVPLPGPDERLKSKSPNVDLLLTGKMLESLTVLQPKTGKVILIFKDKKAKWHNRGVKLKKGSIPARRMIPIGSEKFKASILKILDKIFLKALTNEARALLKS